MKLQQTLKAVAMGLCLSFLTLQEAKAISFNFTKIADSRSSYTSFFGSPALNNLGTVAFGAFLPEDEAAIFTSNGILNTLIADTKSQFNLVENFALNDRGTVAFRAEYSENQVGIFIGDGTEIKPIALREIESEMYGYNDLGFPDINNSDVVAYNFVNYPFGGGVRTGTGDPVDVSNEGTGDNLSYYGDPTINDAGIVTYFYANRGAISGLFINNQLIPGFRGIFGFFGDPIINNLETVAAIHNGSEIYAIKGDRAIPVLGSEGEFNFFRNLALNDNDQVAFLAELDNGKQGIYLQDIPKTPGFPVPNFGDIPDENPIPVEFPKNGSQKVIGVGDLLFDLAIEELKFFREGFNNRGQVAFFAKFADNSSGIFLATPNSTSVPEPRATGGILAFGVLGVIWGLKRRFLLSQFPN